MTFPALTVRVDLVRSDERANTGQDIASHLRCIANLIESESKGPLASASGLLRSDGKRAGSWAVKQEALYDAKQDKPQAPEVGPDRRW